jgi:AcrR family transcriptional regulator
MSIFGRPSVKEQQQKVREDAILDATHALLARKGFDLMTVDDVASEAGVAKASLYKHFDSKDALAAMVMIRLLDRALEHLRALPADTPAGEKLESLLRWALQLRLEGGLPLLPSTSLALRDGLLRNRPYVQRILQLNDEMSRLIEAAKAQGALTLSLPTDVILFTIYARTCDPSVDYLKMTGQYDDEQITEHLVQAAFDGVRTHRAQGGRGPRAGAAA